MSEFVVPCVRIGAITKHPNADTLSITEVEGQPVVFRTGDFKEGDLAIYIPVEAVIPENEPWVKNHLSFLEFKSGKHRVKAKKLRGVFSMGILIGPRVETGDSVRGSFLQALEGSVRLAEALKITKYEEPEEFVPEPKEPPTFWERLAWRVRRFLGLPQKRRKAQPRPFPVYDLDNFRKYHGLFEPGELVEVTEKIHGTNFVFGRVGKKGELVVSSHKVIRKEDNSVYWRAVRELKLDKALPLGLAFYAEIYGNGVQDLAYDTRLGMKVFDVYDTVNKCWLSLRDRNEAVWEAGLSLVPEMYLGSFNKAFIESLQNGKTNLGRGSHIREGVVVRRVHETLDKPRLVLKLVGSDYLLRKGGTERH